ncbi:MULTISPECIES: ABC transporter permease [unclassified Butyrivibrio]|uniref:ABC transporter permease n=1 Tax=unclassified Butyrivibrio TaxID=2639466 RepID=UPI0004092717|nr:ABC transporter permease subunit [Butyrivibrio sp. LC3010]
MAEKKSSAKGRTRSNGIAYWIMVIPGYIWLFMFSIVPMVGIIMAFQDYNPSKGWFGSKWVGFKWFEYLLVIPDAKRALANTLIIAISKVVLNIVIPLIFALLLNEIRNMKFKKTVQTIVYLPHFISWVILANIVTNMLGSSGILNLIIKTFGGEPILLMTMPKTFRQLLIGTDVWKEFGYNAVIYLAALTGIDPTLYEAAAIDGSSKWQSVWHITIPGLIPTIVLLTTLAMGNVLNAGFDQVFNMYNSLVMETGDILDTYVYRIGITNMQFSLATAAGLFKSVVSFILVVTSYVLANKYADYNIF